MDLKQVTVIRRKYPDGKGGTRGVNAGKYIAQGQHGAMQFIVESLEPMPFLGDDVSNIHLSRLEIFWLLNGMTKIVVQVDTLEEIQAIHAEALARDMKSFLVTDSGHTEFNGVPTVTCLTIGPDLREKFVNLTDELKQY
jgi:PTH2 family peptidyl-tRNA hydrolase